MSSILILCLLLLVIFIIIWAPCSSRTNINTTAAKSNVQSKEEVNNNNNHNIQTFQYVAGTFGWGDIVIGLVSSYCILKTLGLTFDSWEWYLPAWVQDYFDFEVKCGFLSHDGKLPESAGQMDGWDICNRSLRQVRRDVLQNRKWCEWVISDRSNWLPLPRRLITNVPWFALYLHDKYDDPQGDGTGNQEKEWFEEEASALFRQVITSWARPKQHVMNIVTELLNRHDVIIHIRSGDFYCAATEGHRVFSSESMEHFVRLIETQVLARHPSKKGIYVAADSEWALSQIPKHWHSWDIDTNLPSHSFHTLQRKDVSHLRTVVEFLLFFYAPVIVVCDNSNFSKVGAIANSSAVRYSYEEYSQTMSLISSSEQLFEKSNQRKQVK